METISDNVWRWLDIAKDMEQQGGLKNVTVFASSFNENRCVGRTEKGYSDMVSYRQKAVLQ